MKERRADRPGTDVLTSPLRAVCRLVAFFLLTAVLLPVQIAAHGFDMPLARRLPRWYHRTLCRLLGIDVRIKGKITPARPTLFVSNHISYTDIVVFGAVLEASFIAKAEIANWPFFGLMARLQRTVFIERIGRQVASQKASISRRLRAGDNMILFPEGTSHDSQHVLPFKSALFSVAETGENDPPLTIQPVSIAYTHLDGIPLHRAFRPRYAWYGDMTLMPHLFRMLGTGVVSIVVTFHEPVSGNRFGTRKALADHCYRAVVAGVDAANSGRAPPELPLDAAPANS